MNMQNLPVMEQWDWLVLLTDLPNAVIIKDGWLIVCMNLDVRWHLKDDSVFGNVRPPNIGQDMNPKCKWPPQIRMCIVWRVSLHACALAQYEHDGSRRKINGVKRLYRIPSEVNLNPDHMLMCKPLTLQRESLFILFYFTRGSCVPKRGYFFPRWN